MNTYKIITLILTVLFAGNVLAEDLDTLKVVDVEEVLVIAAPKENRKLREQPTAVTLLSQKDMRATQVGSIKNLTGLVPNMFIPDYGSRLTSAVYIRGIGSRINTPSIGLYVDISPTLTSLLSISIIPISNVSMYCVARKVHCTDATQWEG